MKRFTETLKWGDLWFRKLSPGAKLLWSWLCDNCDQAGVLEPDFDLASFQIGLRVGIDTLSEFGDRVSKLNSGKYLIVKFVSFQYGKLSKECKPHAPVFAALRKHGIDPIDIKQNPKVTQPVEGVLRSEIIERDGLVCAYTGKTLEPWEAVIDHIVPQAKGGQTEPQNLVVCEATVRTRKGDLDLEEFCRREGLDFVKLSASLRNKVSKPIKGYPVGIEYLQEKEKEKDKDKDKEKEMDSLKEGGVGETKPQTKAESKARGTLDEFKAFFTEEGLPEPDALYFFNKCEGCGWMNGKNQIKDWRATVRAWKAGKFFPSQKPELTQPSRSSYSLGYIPDAA